jgi:hypothetical protein
VLNIPAGNQRAILVQRELNIQRPGGQEYPIEEGVLHHYCICIYEIISMYLLVIFLASFHSQNNLDQCYQSGLLLYVS